MNATPAPNETESFEDAPAELHIHCATDLFNAIRHGEYFERLHLLEALAADPMVGLEYGSHEGQDLVDVLRLELEASSDPNLRAMLMAVLVGIPNDARVVAALFREWCLSINPDEQLLALERLVYEPDAEVQAQLGIMLRQDDDPDRARMVANHWAARADLGPADRLRAAIACEFECPPPPALELETSALWRAALNGPFRQRAREWLEAQGEPAFEQMAAWPKRSNETSSWLLGWGTHAAFPGAARLARQTLAANDTALYEAGLHALAHLGAQGEETTKLLERFASAEAPLRLEAVRAGLRLDFPSLALEEADAALRLEAIARLEASDLIVLTRLLEDTDWRVRARATERLIALGQVAIPAMRAVLDDTRLEVRTAAARVLMELGEDAWLEERLL